MRLLPVSAALLVCLLGMSQGPTVLAADPSDKELLNIYDGLTQELGTTLQSKPQCQGYADFSGNGANCDFAGLCSPLAANVNSVDLYVSADGKRVPNYGLFFLEQKVAQCFNLRRMKELTADPKKSMDDFQKRNLNVLKAQKNFMATLRKNNETDSFAAMNEALLDVAIDDAEQNKLIGMNGYIKIKTREELLEEFNKNEKLAKLSKPISQETKEAWVAGQLAQQAVYQPVGYAGSVGVIADDKGAFPKAWKTMNQNPFVRTELFRDSKVAGTKEKVLENQHLYQAELDRAYDLFIDSQKSIVAMLKQKRTKENATQIDAMIQRVDTVRMKPTDLDSSFQFGPCTAPNAFYDPIDHRFTLCPQILQLPSAGIKSIIAHELAHSIDPCLASMELVTVHPSAKEEVMQKEFARQMQEFEKQQEQNGVYSYKPVLKQPESKVKYAADFLGLVSQNSMTDQVSPAISLKTNPFTSTIECLKSRESIAARATSDAEVQKIMTDAIDNLKKTGATEENSEQLKSYNKALSSLSERMGKNGACSFMPGQSGQSQVQEAFADWVATEVLGKDVERADAAKKKDMAFESMAFFLALECPAKTNASTKAKELLTAMKCGGESSISDLNSIYDAMGRNSDSHPFGQARVNRLFLAQPQIAKALGCEGKKTGGEAEVKHCE